MHDRMTTPRPPVSVRERSTSQGFLKAFEHNLSINSCNISLYFQEGIVGLFVCRTINQKTSVSQSIPHSLQFPLTETFSKSYIMKYIMYIKDIHNAADRFIHNARYEAVMKPVMKPVMKVGFMKCVMNIFYMYDQFFIYLVGIPMYCN